MTREGGCRWGLVACWGAAHWGVALCGVVVWAAGCVPRARDSGFGSSGAPIQAGDSEPELVKVFPFVRAVPEGGVVEFDGFVPVDAHDPETPDVYLEVIACAVDTREHESLVATRARPAHIHAALLLAGGEPGAPGRFEWRDEAMLRHPPRGQRVRVDLLVPGSPRVPSDPGRWIRDHSGRGLGEHPWVFAGSREVERSGRVVYDADGTGQIVGLHTFGSEVVAWARVAHPDSGVDEPEWLADARVVPVFGTPVTVRLTLEPERR